MINIPVPDCACANLGGIAFIRHLDVAPKLAQTHHNESALRMSKFCAKLYKSLFGTRAGVYESKI